MDTPPAGAWRAPMRQGIQITPAGMTEINFKAIIQGMGLSPGSCGGSSVEPPEASQALAKHMHAVHARHRCRQPVADKQRQRSAPLVAVVGFPTDPPYFFVAGALWRS